MGSATNRFSRGRKSAATRSCNAGWRMFEWNYAIAMRTTVLKNVIGLYKYGARRRWAAIFGRIVAGFLEEHDSLFSEFDLIVASPTYLGPGGRSFDHTRDVLAVADIETPGRWPFDIEGPPAIVLQPPQQRWPAFRRTQGRKEKAQTELRDCPQHPGSTPAEREGDPRVTTTSSPTGLVLNEVARAYRRRRCGPRVREAVAHRRRVD